jgi:signal transduction histidine kinase
MNLQAKLTFGAVALETLIVGVISAVDLGIVMQLEFDAAKYRAGLVRDVASEYVLQVLNRLPPLPPREALRDPMLRGRLSKLLTESNELIEIAVVDPATQQILADSLPDPGQISRKYPDFDDLVTRSGWLQKLTLISARENRFYQMEKTLGREAGAPLAFVRVIVYPALIVKHFVWPEIRHSAEVGVLLFAGAVLLTFVVSAIAFRRLGQLGHMIDLVASGEYAPEKPGVIQASKDELGVMASKVNLLSERLRGAQFEVSDLRGNIDRLLHDLEDAVFIFDRELRLMFASGSVEKFLRRERADLTRLSLAEIFPPSATLGLIIAQAAQTGRSLRNRRVPVAAEGGGTQVVLLSVDMLESDAGAGNGSGLLVRLRDPEAQKQLGRELQTADRLAAISRVSGGVAHEVKNPLNAILLHVEVAKAKLAKGDTDVIPQMEIIASEILRLDRVVKTFLDFTRPVELRLETVPVRMLLDDVLELARPQADASKIRVVVGHEADGVGVRIDRDLLKQAMLNVVVNAMQAMPDGGELRFDSIAGEDSAEIRISDTGGGIPAELRDKIFRLYFSTKKDGSGIGLAMTFRIVQLHDGTIDFTSEPGKGTTFSIRLPIAS